jgi:hypothetical protein
MPFGFPMTRKISLVTLPSKTRRSAKQEKIGGSRFRHVSVIGAWVNCHFPVCGSVVMLGVIRCDSKISGVS